MSLLYRINNNKGDEKVSSYQSLLSQAKYHFLESHPSVREIYYECCGALPDLKNIEKLNHNVKVVGRDNDKTQIAAAQTRIDQVSVDAVAYYGDALQAHSFDTKGPSLSINQFSLTTFHPNDYGELIYHTHCSVPAETPLYFMFHDVDLPGLTDPNEYCSVKKHGRKFTMEIEGSQRFSGLAIKKENAFNDRKFANAAYERSKRHVTYYVPDLEDLEIDTDLRLLVESVCLARLSSSGAAFKIKGWRPRGAPRIPEKNLTIDDHRAIIDITQIPLMLPGSFYDWSEKKPSDTLIQEEKPIFEQVSLETQEFTKKWKPVPKTTKKMAWKDLAATWVEMPGLNEKCFFNTYKGPLHTCHICKTKIAFPVALFNENRGPDICYPCVGLYTDQQYEKSIVNDLVNDENAYEYKTSVLGSLTDVRDEFEYEESVSDANMNAWKDYSPHIEETPEHVYNYLKTSIPGFFIYRSGSVEGFGSHISAASLGVSKVAMVGRRVSNTWGAYYTGEKRGFAKMNNMTEEISDKLSMIERSIKLEPGLFNQFEEMTYAPSTDFRTPPHIPYHRDAMGEIGPVWVGNLQGEAKISLKNLTTQKETSFKLLAGDSYIMTGIAITHYAHTAVSVEPFRKRVVYIARHIGDNDDLLTGKNMRNNSGKWGLTKNGLGGVPFSQGLHIGKGKYHGDYTKPGVPVGKPLTDVLKISGKSEEGKTVPVKFSMSPQLRVALGGN